MEIELVRGILKSLPPPFYGANTYDEEEINAAVRVIHNQSPFRYYGKKCTNEAQQFEDEAARYYGVKYACATNSGSGGLLLALHALDVGPGDEVVVPGYFWIAVSNAILLRGAIPVICEVGPTINMDPADLRRKMTKKTKCVVAVHMFGGQAEIPEIRKICDEKGLKLIEDFSQCNGASIQGKRIGSFGDIGVSSLQLNKAITAGEGGILVTDNANYYEKAAARSDMGYPRAGGVSSAEAKSSFVTVGEGRRFNEVSAAIMRVQLRKLPEIARHMAASKQAIVSRLKVRGGCELRKVVDPAGDLGSTLAFVFPTEKEASAFSASGEKALGKEDWFVSQLKNMGLHIYYNCTNLVKKIPVLPGGFPWNLKENQGSYSYEKGTCPATDSILARSVGLSIAPDLSPLHEEALAEGLNLAFKGM